MQTIGIKELQTNPSVLTKSLEKNDLILITKRSKPIGLALSFDENIISLGLKKALLIDAYKHGLISLGQLSSELDMKKDEVMKFLSNMGISVIDYDFSDDLEFVKDFNDSK